MIMIDLPKLIYFPVEWPHPAKSNVNKAYPALIAGSMNCLA